ncbi:electron transport protein [Paenibacillus antri]|uniref:Electron transport protein n=1 Tax=Paenibacillus antri TaxID=2582848 RepID=A0A5R9G6W0_9BACL|nr:electron transport protein [Paenibacillus antri]TLS48724.1 electron transport protein [Paenibacillus antri]
MGFRNKRLWIGVCTLLIFALAAASGWKLAKLQYAYVPGRHEAANPPREPRTSDGRGFTAAQAEDPLPYETPDTVDFGRKAFYGETFGNEVYLTDILGMFDGPISLKSMLAATVRLRGRGTSNLRVQAEKTAIVGGRTIRKGEWIDTGLDVAKGAYVPLGIKVTADRGKIRAGVSCITCHAIYDGPSGKIVEGAPNPDVNAGLLLAASTNSASFFTHTDVDNLSEYLKDVSRTVPTSDGGQAPLPDPDALEDAVDRALLRWPPGFIDTVLDLKNAPVQIPDSFTRGDFPYARNGMSANGPRHGLVFFSGVPNGQNMDPTAQAHLSKKAFGIDPELYLGTLLQRAANPKFRYDPASGKKPSEFFASIDPTPGTPGVNELVPTPDYPNVSFVSFVGMLASKPGYRIGEHLIGLAAYQDALDPPPSRIEAAPEEVELGRRVFEKAGCIACHAGDYLTNNRVIAQSIIGTEPTRGKALSYSEKAWGRNLMYDWSTPVPLPSRPKTFRIPYETPAEDIELTLAHDGGEGGEGGYKIPSLWGLYWSAPYLHDGGVAVGKDAGRQLGIPGTWYAGVAPDPVNSLRALLDRGLRERVVAANRANADAAGARIVGQGHEYWIDASAGFTKREQDAVIRYLLKINDSKQ